MSGVRQQYVARDEDGMRLDRWFETHFPQVTFGHLQKLLRSGQIRVDSGRAKSNTRLASGQLVRVRGGELPSEGMVPGVLQVPPTGRPVVLLADGPVTGGYPVIAVLTDAALDAIAQARPGTRIRFRHARAN